MKMLVFQWFRCFVGSPPFGASFWPPLASCWPLAFPARASRQSKKRVSAARATYRWSAVPLREKTPARGDESSWKNLSRQREPSTHRALCPRAKITLAPHDATALTKKTFLDSAGRLRYTLPLREKTLAPHDEHDIFRKGQARLEGPALPATTFLCSAREKTLPPREEYNIYILRFTLRRACFTQGNFRGNRLSTIYSRNIIH